MKYGKQFGLFWYRFIFGNDIVSASIVIAGFLGMYFLARTSFPAFWLLPVFVLVSLGVGIWRLQSSASSSD